MLPQCLVNKLLEGPKEHERGLQDATLFMSPVSPKFHASPGKLSTLTPMPPGNQQDPLISEDRPSELVRQY